MGQNSISWLVDKDFKEAAQYVAQVEIYTQCKHFMAAIYPLLHHSYKLFKWNFVNCCVATVIAWMNEI